MTDNGTGQRLKGRRECKWLDQQKENQFCVPTQRSYFFVSLLSLKKKFLSLHKLPPANAAVKCKMPGRMWVAGRGEATQRVYAAVTG